MRLVCFGGLSCPEPYECPSPARCKQACFDELASVPLEAVHVVTAFRIREKLLKGVPESVIACAEERAMMEYCWARECKVKVKEQRK